VSDGCQERFLSEIFKFQANCRANIFATSRYIPEITKKFKGSTLLEILASKEDVQKYVEGHIRQLQPFIKKKPQLQEEIKTRISDAVDGMCVSSY